VKDYLFELRVAAEKRIVFTQHALDEMNAPDEMISIAEIRHVVRNGTVLEEYPEDKRGHSGLVAGVTGQNRVVHVVCAPKEEYLAIITAYVPSREKWEDDLMKRRAR
jgi:uncharacterized protein DUF4258